MLAMLLSACFPARDDLGKCWASLGFPRPICPEHLNVFYVK